MYFRGRTAPPIVDWNLIDVVDAKKSWQYAKMKKRKSQAIHDTQNKNSNIIENHYSKEEGPNAALFCDWESSLTLFPHTHTSTLKDARAANVSVWNEAACHTRQQREHVIANALIPSKAVISISMNLDHGLHAVHVMRSTYTKTQSADSILSEARVDNVSAVTHVELDDFS